MRRIIPVLVSFALICAACESQKDSGPSTSEASGGSSSGGSIQDPSTGSGGTIDVVPSRHDGDVTLRDDTVEFRHADFVLDDDNSVASTNEGNIVTSTFATKIIENDLIRVTVLPEYGGRILSIIYKPTNHEMLYQNPVAAPFGVDQGYFYYDWLMVYGGIFPTFPEAEHGKTWFLPWSAEIIEESGDEVALRMTFTDDIDPEEGVPPERFGYGRTDLTMTATVRVKRGSSTVYFDLALANDRDTAVPYEYWTCTTLTPGSAPSASASPANTEMVVPIDEVYSTYGWVGGVAESVGDNVYEYDELRMFGSWADAGILYAHPRMEQDYWGVINHDAEVGIFRIADADVTPGLKFWTWGAESVNSDPEETDERRPYIELWAGHSTQFFSPAEIGPGETISWTEAYVPTVGLREITSVNEYASGHLEWSSNAEGLQISAHLFSSIPSVNLEVELFSDGDARLVLATETWSPDATTATTISTQVSDGALEAGDQIGVVVRTTDGQTVFETERPFSP